MSKATAVTAGRFPARPDVASAATSRRTAARSTFPLDRRGNAVTVNSRRGRL